MVDICHYFETIFHHSFIVKLFSLIPTYVQYTMDMLYSLLIVPLVSRLGLFTEKPDYVAIFYQTRIPSEGRFYHVTFWVSVVT